MLKEIAEFASARYAFGVDDFFQQLIGGALLSSPFLFTEEVWRIAANTSIYQSLTTTLITLAIGHGVLYVASQQRDFKEERKIFGITYRYISLMAVAYGSVILMLGLTSTAQTFGASIYTTAKAVSIISFFSVIGAATADNLI